MTAGAPPTGFYLHPDAALHDPGWGHPEHQGRLRHLASTVGKDLLSLHDRVRQHEAGRASVEALSRVHTPEHLERLRAESARAETEGESVQVGPETFVSGASWRAIAGSTGALLDAVERVAAGELRNAFVATRPPGHHASVDAAMGFCPVNHVAVAARHLQATGRAERVAIVDWDVHHGNGTQAIFYDDPTVYYLSIHQSPAFPGTGSIEERGVGPGTGSTRNLPLPAGTGGPTYRARFDEVLSLAEAEFEPDFLLVSAGFDALAGDPLGGFQLNPDDFHALTRRLMEWADRACAGRVAAALEGGYEPRLTGMAVVSTLRALAGLEAVSLRAGAGAT